MFMTRLTFPVLWRRCAKGAVGASCIWNKAGFCLLLCCCCCCCWSNFAEKYKQEQAHYRQSAAVGRTKSCCAAAAAASHFLCRSSTHQGGAPATQVPWPPSRICTRLSQLAAQPQNMHFPKCWSQSLYSEIWPKNHKFQEKCRILASTKTLKEVNLLRSDAGPFGLTISVQPPNCVGIRCDSLIHTKMFPELHTALWISHH